MADDTQNVNEGTDGASELTAKLGEWISVDDRLPTNGNDVLAIVLDKDNAKGWHWEIVSFGHYEFYTFDENHPDADDEGLVVKKGWHYERDSEGEYDRLCFDLEGKVTHWMPLPQPPNI